MGAKHFGARITRLEDPALLTGRGQFVDDINLPGTMDGIALAECVRKRWPPTVIVFCSGNNLTDLRPIPPDIHFLPKPYENNALARVVKGVFAKLGDLA